MPTATPLLTRLTATAAVPARARAIDARPICVMIIGDHPDAADILTPARQVGLQHMTDALARFRPTVVAVEWPAAIVAERYARYLAGTLAPSRSEVVQLGFRLARQTGARIVGVGQHGETLCASRLCAALSEVGRPGDRMVVLHDTALSAALRRQVVATRGLKLVEASEALGL